jgi:hypothetical protein
MEDDDMSRIFFLTALLLAFSSFFSASGVTWHVDGSVPTSGDGTSWENALKTIQEGIDAASDGDTVLVGQGSYVENIYFKGKNIILTSTDPLDPTVVANTIIDPNQKGGSAVTFGGTETEACALSGFTIRNGWAWGLGGGGICGGAWHQPTHATIRNNVITGNISHNEGGGIAYCDGIIEHNLVSENTGCLGGGLYCCDGTVRNNTIVGNVAVGPLIEQVYINIDHIPPEGPYPPPRLGAMGGGLYACQGTIEGNVITRNRLGGSDSLGAGLCACHGIIRNNIIVGNAATWGSGGGLASCGGLSYNNTIITNWALSGGGLYRCDDMIRNCIIWGNLADQGAQLYESSEPTYSCVQNWTGGEGNIAADPSVIIPARCDDNNTPDWTYDDILIEGNYHLRLDSPCIASGLNEDWMQGAADLDGNPRIWNGTVDMGAYEYGSFPFKITEVVQAGGSRLTWTSRAGDIYTVWSCDDLLGGSWTEQETVPSGGETTVWSDPDTASSRKFYRIEVR